MGRFSIISLVLLVGLSCKFVPSKALCPVSLDLKPRIDTQSSGLVHAELKNLTDKAVQLPDTSLPWKSSNALQVVALGSEGGDQMANMYLLYHPFGPGNLALDPGEKKSEIISIAEYFTIPKGRVSIRGVTIFWRWSHEVNGAPCVLHGSFQVQ